MLILENPQVAFRDCNHCLKYLYYESGKHAGEPAKHGDQLQKRHAGCPPPCRTEKGCLKGTPEEQNTLSHRHWKTYRHYLRCKATGNFPDDEIVARNADIIKRMEDNAERSRQSSLTLQALRLAKIG